MNLLEHINVGSINDRKAQKSGERRTFWKGGAKLFTALRVNGWSSCQMPEPLISLRWFANRASQYHDRGSKNRKEPSRDSSFHHYHRDGKSQRYFPRMNQNQESGETNQSKALLGIIIADSLTCWERSSARYPAENDRCGIRDLTNQRKSSKPGNGQCIYKRTSHQCLIRPRISPSPRAECDSGEGPPPDQEHNNKNTSSTAQCGRTGEIWGVG